MTSSTILTIRERREYRKGLKELERLVSMVEDDLLGKQALDEQISIAMEKISGTVEREGQFAYIKELYKQLDERYDYELKYAGQFKLSHFCEYIARDEYPAPHHEFMIDRLEKVADRELLRLMISMPPGHAKAQALDSVVFLASGGTKTIADVAVGDRIQGPNGVVVVTAKSPVFMGKRCFKASTSDGATVIVSEDHLWNIRLCNKREVYHNKTTAQLFTRQLVMTEKRRGKLPDYTAVEYPKRVLPIDPYVLGLWLGDGYSADARLSAMPADADIYRLHVSKAGYTLGEHKGGYRHTIHGLRPHLVNCGLLGNKHVPEVYKYSSVDQRMELLRGLMDTDGTVSKRDGQCSFANKNRNLVDAVADIVRSLGTKASVIESRSVINDKDHGAYWRVCFYMKDVFKLPRKRCLNTDTNKRHNIRTISFEEVPSVPTQCITVSSVDGLYFTNGYIVTHNSTYSSHRFPAWYLGRFPDHKWLQAAHTMEFARNRLGKPVRSIISSERYRDIFPEMALSHDSAAADFFEFAGHSGYYKAVGVGVGVAGYRADIQSVDDPFKSREDAESKTIRDKVFNWYSADFTTRMARKDMPQFVVATRWHPDDLCGRLEEMNREGKGIPFEIVNLPAIANDDDPLGRKPGEPLWDNFPLEILMELKSKLPGRDWNSLYMGNPVDEEGGTLKKDDVYRYDRLPEDVYRGGQLVNKVIRRVILSVDCAEKDTQRSDYTAATVWIETADRKHYLKHAARIRAGFNQIVDFIDHLAEAHNVDAVLCEDRGAGTQYIQVRAQQKGPAPVIAINTKQQDKSFRFDGVTPMFIAREVFLPKDGKEWIADVEAELFAFPVGRNDDYVDSISQYLTWARGDRIKRGVRKLMGTGLHA